MAGVFVLKAGAGRGRTRISEYREFLRIAEDIIENPSYQRLKGIRHHDSDIYSHNIKVAWLSFILARRMKLRVREVVRGALLHDFFFYDWHKGEGRVRGIPHGFTHPGASYRNAVEIYGELTPLEKDIIVKHMWPLTPIPPGYRESFLVSFADKAVALIEAAGSLFMNV